MPLDDYEGDATELVETYGMYDSEHAPKELVEGELSQIF